MKPIISVVAALLVAACAAYSGRGLIPASSGLADVVRVMGEPAMRWQNPDGSVQLAYPRGPAGFHTFMVRIGPDGKLQSIENVLDTKGFAKITPGMTEDQVLKILGPSYPAWTSYFSARDERVWQWRYCDDRNIAGHFSVLFNAGAARVRTTMSIPESCGLAYCSCSK